MTRACPSKVLAVLGLDEPTVLPCIGIEGHIGTHRYLIEWSDDGTQEVVGS